jgi:hypothetical protein
MKEMRTSTVRSIRRSVTGLLMAAVVVVCAAIVLTDDAGAWPPYLVDWEDKYPDSTLPQRMEDQFGAACFVCHHPGDFGAIGTCYRDDIRQLLKDGFTILEALDIADGMDSDGDGVTNGEQINMPHAHLPGEIGYHPGLSGCFGNDACGPDPDAPLTGVPETPTVDFIPGDLNCDGLVNVADLLILFDHWGPCPGGIDPCIADLNGDEVVNVGDLLILFDNWG